MLTQLSPPSVVITAGICIFMIWLFRVAQSKENPAAWGSYLVSVGIFGTFLGITIALISFDATAIEESVPGLLGGMQVAFISSAMGIFLSLVLRWKNLSTPTGESSEEKTADDIFSVLNDHTSLLKSLETALVGDGDTTLISQLKLLRQESKDGANQIRVSLDKFAETLAENNSKAFIAALEGAVREFNDKLSEQFGENFKRLNEAVGKLLDWQENYRLQLAEMMRAFSEIETRMKDASSSLGDVAKRTEALATVSEQQATWLQAQLSAQTELEARLQAFSAMAVEAKSALPVINKNLEDITEGMKRSVKESLGSIEEAMQGFKTGVTETQDQVVAITNNLSQEIKTNVTSFQQQSLDANAKHQQRLEDSVKELDRMLGKELSKSLESLGSQLVTLSGKFVQDYTPLTESLRKLVQLSSRIKQ